MDSPLGLLGSQRAKSPSQGSNHKFNARAESKSPGRGAVFKMDFSKPQSTDEFTPAIYKEKDPISACTKMRV